jgi:hypothetical protein
VLRGIELHGGLLGGRTWLKTSEGIIYLCECVFVCVRLGYAASGCALDTTAITITTLWVSCIESYQPTACPLLIFSVILCPIDSRWMA